MATKHSPYLMLDDLDSFMLAHPATSLLIADLLENGTIELSRIRVDSDNYEQWTYVNPEFDAEVELRNKDR